jgi:hypothetical protein
MTQKWLRSALATHRGLLFSVCASAVGFLLLADRIPHVHPHLSGFPWDLAVDHLTAQGFLDHVNPFTASGAEKLNLAQRFGNSGSGHPPTTSFWALPLARLSVEQANSVVGWVTLLLLLLEFVGIFEALGWPAVLSASWLAFAYLMSCNFMQYHIAVGQFSGVIGFLYFVSWRAGRRGEELLSGGALGLACTMKLFPGVILVLFAVQRRWQALGAAVGAFLAIAVIMTSRYGLAAWPFFLSKQSAIANSWMASLQNQSIHGVVLRYLYHPVCKGGGGLAPVATALSAGISFGLIALAAWLAQGSARASRDAYDVSFALFVVLSVITSQWAWEHYTIIYVLPAAIAIDKLARAFGTGARRWQAAVMLLLAFGVVASWHVDMNIKTNLQRAVLGGDRSVHLRLHLYDILNWAPPFVLAGLLYSMARRFRVDPGSARGWWSPIYWETTA